MVKYGESYLTCNNTFNVSAKNTAKISGFDITSTAKLRTLSHIVSKLKEIESSINVNSDIGVYPDKFRAIRKAEANLTSYTNIDTIIVKPFKDGPADLESESQFKLSEYYAQIWRIKDMQTPYIEGHTIRYELTDGYVFNQDMECYSNATTLFTFNVPFVTGSIFDSSTVNQNTIMTRVRFFESDLDSQISMFARGNYNYGQFASLLFPYAIQDDIPGKRIRYYYVDLDSSVSIIAVPYNFTKAQAYLDSLFTLLYPMTNVIRNFNSNIIDGIFINAENKRIRFFPSDLISNFQHTNLEDTRIRRTLISLISNFQHANLEDTRLRRTLVSFVSNNSISAPPYNFTKATANLSTFATMNCTAQFGELTLTLNIVNANEYVDILSGDQFTVNPSLEVDWGGSTYLTQIGSQFYRYYSVAGTYEVRIKADETTQFPDNDSLNGWTFRGVSFGPFRESYAGNTYSIKSWGSKKQESVNGFQRINLQHVYLDGSAIFVDEPFTDSEGFINECVGVPPTLPTRFKTFSLEGAYRFNDPNVSNYDVSNLPVGKLFRVFRKCRAFNQPLNNWNVSNMTDMSYWFQDAQAFNQPLNNWNTVNVTNMKKMFQGATNFNQNISSWNTSNVTDMSYMFASILDVSPIQAFNQPIGTWNTANVTNMSYMFRRSQFNQPIGTWNTAKVTNMSYMFSDAGSFDRPILTSGTSWNTALVTDMRNMFDGATAFNQSIGNWNTANVTRMDYMFRNAASFNLTIGTWNTAKVTNMAGMFEGATSFNRSISTSGNSWNTALVTNMGAMFKDATAFNQNISSWNTASVTGMISMFDGATAFNQPLTRSGNSWNTANVTNMSSMFKDATAFNQDISNWCVPLIPIEPSSFDFNTPSWVKTNRQPIWGTCP